MKCRALSTAAVALVAIPIALAGCGAGPTGTEPPSSPAIPQCDLPKGADYVCLKTEKTIVYADRQTGEELTAQGSPRSLGSRTTVETDEDGKASIGFKEGRCALSTKRRHWWSAPRRLVRTCCSRNMAVPVVGCPKGQRSQLRGKLSSQRRDGSSR